MQKYGVIFCCLGCLALCAYLLERSAFFAGAKDALQRQEVPSSILNIGKMGKILKEKGLIRTLPGKETAASGTIQDISRSLLVLDIDISVDAQLQVYWAESASQKYSTERCRTLSGTAGQRAYGFLLPDLTKIHRLRIDPAEKPADIKIHRIILYSDEQEIVLSPGKGLDLLKPLAGVGPLQYDSQHDTGGVFFTTLHSDGQIELRLDAVRGPRKIEQLAFPRKRQKTLYQHVVDDGPQSFPSSQIIRQEHFKKNWPIMSLVIDEENLYHPDTGLLANKTARGRQWERPASCSYFDENGKLRFASMVGVRMHGGKRIQFYSSFRLYFRKEYGLSQFPEFRPRIGFSTHAEPVKRLVVHHTAWPENGWHFNNTLAYDIARHIGCQVPETKLTLLYVNGVEQGIYFFVPHIGERLLQSYFGHKDFISYKHRSEVTPEGYALDIDLLWATVTKKEKLSAKEVGKKIDLDNLARNLFSIIFCGTNDWYQGVAVLDTSKPDAKVFWINWDMDQSFIQKIESEEVLMTEWQQRSWDLVYTTSLKRFYDARAPLFSRLLREDSAYRHQVLTLYQNLLNHRLNARFAEERIGYYTSMLEHYGKKDTKYMQMLGEFMKRRPEVVRKDTEELFQLGPSVLCRIIGPPDVRYEIDGYQEPAGYQGYYFKGSRMKVRVNKAPGKRFAYWLVNGERVDSIALNIEVQEKLIIEPFFDESS